LHNRKKTIPDVRDTAEAEHFPHNFCGETYRSPVIEKGLFEKHEEMIGEEKKFSKQRSPTPPSPPTPPAPALLML